MVTKIPVPDAWSIWTDNRTLKVVATNSPDYIFLALLNGSEAPAPLNPWLSLPAIGGILHSKYDGYLIPMNRLPHIDFWLQHFHQLDSKNSYTEMGPDRASVFWISQLETLLLVSLLDPKSRDEIREILASRRLEASSKLPTFHQYLALELEYLQVREASRLQPGDIVKHEFAESELQGYPVIYDGKSLLETWSVQNREVELPRQFKCPPYSAVYYQLLSPDAPTPVWPELEESKLQDVTVATTTRLLDAKGQDLTESILGSNWVALQVSYKQGFRLTIFVGRGPGVAQGLNDDDARDWIIDTRAKFYGIQPQMVYTVVSE